MNHDMIERYIYAVTKRMRPKVREDVSLELRGLIDDMLAERCGEEIPTEKDIRIVLTELGSPQELYAKYDEDAGKCLIGQPYYSTYKFVLRIILACAALGLTLSAVIMQIMEPRAWYEAAASWLSMLWSGILMAFAFTTLLFAFFSHKGVKLEESFDLDALPPVPKKKQQISIGDTVANIGIITVFLAVFLAFPQVFSSKIGDVWIPCFDAEAVRGSWYILILFALAGLVRESVKLMEKRYNLWVLAVSVITNIVSAVLCIWWLAGGQIMNPAFVQTMAQVFEGDARFLSEIFGNFNLFLMGVMLLALVMDTLDAVLKMERPLTCSRK